MRISRTNFYPILETEGESDAQAPYYTHENNALSEFVPEAEEWHAADEPVANDEDYRPRFRSPALRSYDPGQYADGSWESHFYMAPNVRFTRTPDKVAAKIEEAAAEEVQQAEPVVEQVAPATKLSEAAQLSQSELLQRLREALDDRRRRFEEQQAAAPAEPVPPLVQAVVAAGTTGTPADAAVFYKPAVPLPAPVAVAKPVAKADVRAAISRFAHLSDHAFWETLVPDEDASEMPVRKAATVVRMPAPTPALPVAVATPMPVAVPAKKRDEPNSITALFRVVECRPPVARQPVAETVVVAVPEAKVEPVKTPVIEAVAEIVPVAAEIKPAPVVITPAAVVEPVREMPSSVLSRAKPFQVTLAAPAGAAYE